MRDQKKAQQELQRIQQLEAAVGVKTGAWVHTTVDADCCPTCGSSTAWNFFEGCCYEAACPGPRPDAPRVCYVNRIGISTGQGQIDPEEAIKEIVVVVGRAEGA